VPLSFPVRQQDTRSKNTMHNPSQPSPPPLLQGRKILVVDADRDKLFKDLGRPSVRPTGGEKSTGLGLAICRKIVDAHHGTIAAENLPERGCVFRVILPS